MFLLLLCVTINRLVEAHCGMIITKLQDLILTVTKSLSFGDKRKTPPSFEGAIIMYRLLLSYQIRKEEEMILVLLRHCKNRCGEGLLIDHDKINYYNYISN